MKTTSKSELRDYGTLHDYMTGNPIRPATAQEWRASREAEASNIGGGTGVIDVFGHSVYVAGGDDTTATPAVRAVEPIKPELEAENPPWPPTDAKTGDVWGAYHLDPDGWWRLTPPVTELLAENAKLRQALQLVADSQQFKGGTFPLELQQIARGALGGGK